MCPRVPIRIFPLSFVSCLSCGSLDTLLILKEDFNTLFNFHQNSLKKSRPDVGRAISGYFMTDCSRPRPQMTVCFSVIDFDRNTPKALFPFSVWAAGILSTLSAWIVFFYCTDPNIIQNTKKTPKNTKATVCLLYNYWMFVCCNLNENKPEGNVLFLSSQISGEKC